MYVCMCVKEKLIDDTINTKGARLMTEDKITEKKECVKEKKYKKNKMYKISKRLEEKK